MASPANSLALWTFQTPSARNPIRKNFNFPRLKVIVSSGAIELTWPKPATTLLGAKRLKPTVCPCGHCCGDDLIFAFARRRFRFRRPSIDGAKLRAQLTPQARDAERRSNHRSSQDTASSICLAADDETMP